MKIDRQEFNRVKRELDYLKFPATKESAEWFGYSQSTLRKISKASTFAQYKKLLKAHSKEYSKRGEEFTAGITYGYFSNPYIENKKKIVELIKDIQRKNLEVLKMLDE